jgi:hypothetical protein
MKNIEKMTKYFKEYWVDGKYKGYVLSEKDREEIGYSGRADETVSAEVTLTNKKKLKPGIKAQTILYPLGL